MTLPRIVRAGIGAVTARVPDLADVKAVAERAPAVAFNTALRGAELGVAGYGMARSVTTHANKIARSGIAAGASLLGLSSAPDEPPAPVDDPWSGGPLQPVDDIRDAVELAPEDAAEVEALPAGDSLSHADLPLADYDHLTLGELRSRIRRLSVGELLQLREYEHAHADRLPVVKAFDNRLASLAKSSTAPEQTPAP